jgi:hypothetical protein
VQRPVSTTSSLARLAALYRPTRGFLQPRYAPGYCVGYSCGGGYRGFPMGIAGGAFLGYSARRDQSDCELEEIDAYQALVPPDPYFTANATEGLQQVQTQLGNTTEITTGYFTVRDALENAQPLPLGVLPPEMLNSTYLSNQCLNVGASSAASTASPFTALLLVLGTVVGSWWSRRAENAQCRQEGEE